MSTAIPPSAGNQWRIELFGGLRVRQGDQAVPRSLPRKTGSLLACLAFYRNRSHPREELMELLWPDEDPEATRLRFRQVLTTLRRELDPSGDCINDLLIADRSEVRLNPRVVTTDVDEFESELKHAVRIPQPAERAMVLQKAVDRYGGALLPGFYDEWVSTERQRLSEEYQDALIQLADVLAASGRLRESTEYARKAVAADPIHEASACCLMRTLAAAGRSAEALKHYRTLEQALWRELRVVPSNTTRKVMEAIRTGAIGKVPDNEGQPDNGEAQGSADAEEPIGTQAESTLEQDEERGALPVPRNRFFGRDSELERLVNALAPSPGDGDHSRLVTLVGPGGSGKTRLAIETARRLKPVYQGQVWFVRLAEVHGVERLQTIIAETLSPVDSNITGSLDQVLGALGKTDGLLILDNFEQLVEVGSLVVLRLLERAIGLKCLVTSRQRLNVEGEQELGVLPLPVPEDPDGPDQIESCPSVRLFVDRSRKSRADFALTQGNVAAVGALCRRLEGIPLALELAAGWAGTLTPAQIFARLTRRFDLLVSRRKDIDERHRSLATTISWSFEQLPPQMQRLFVRLSVFRGGWTMESAEAVCMDAVLSDNGAARVHTASLVLEGMEQLRERSLIIAEPYGDQVRFRILETLREFAEQKLNEDEQKPLRERHARHFLSIAERGGRELTGPNQVEWLDGLDADVHNLRAAVAWSFGDDGSIDLGLRLFGSLWRFWDVRGHRVDAEWMWDQLSARCAEASRPAFASGLEGAGSLAVNNRDYAAGETRLKESVDIYRSVDDKAGLARTLCWLGLCLRDTGRLEEAAIALNESLSLAEQLKDRVWTASALAGLGGCANQVKDFVAACSLLDRAAALYRICGHHRGVAWCLLTEGHSAVDHGDYVLAEHRFQEALALYRIIGDRTWVFLAMFFLAHLARASGNLDLALERGEEALSYSRQTRSATWEASFLTWLGDLASDRNDFAEGWSRYREALKISEEREMATDMRSALCGMAGLYGKVGSLELAARLFGAAINIEAPPKTGAHRWYLRDHEMELSDLKQKSDPELFTANWDIGGKMTRSQVIAFAMTVQKKE